MGAAPCLSPGAMGGALASLPRGGTLDPSEGATPSKNAGKPFKNAKPVTGGHDGPPA